MPALISSLIDRPDNVELVRDQIAAILVTEIANQVAIATATPGKDPKLWQLRVFSERSNPWDMFQDPPDASDPSSPLNFDNSPIVNIALDTSTPDGSSSDIVGRQKYTAIFNVDVYGRGISADDGGTGHYAGDEQAAIEAQRAVRLVRSILMSAQYLTLGFPQKPNALVWKRWVQSISMFQPQSDGKAIQHIIAARIVFAVDFNEFSPQWDSVPLLLVGISITRADNGQVFLAPQFSEA